MRLSNISVALCLCFALVACDKAEQQTSPPPAESENLSTPAAQVAPAPTVLPAQASPPEPVPPSTIPPQAQPSEVTSVSAMLEEAKQSAAVSTSARTGDTMDQVADVLRNYLRRQGAPEDGGVANKGGISVEFATGQATSAVPPGSAGFSDARPLAFERAFQNALSHMVQTRSRKIANLVSSALMRNTSDAATFVEACKPDADEALVMKLKQLAHAKMDSALRQLDVPESEISAQKPMYRCENPTLRDSITTNTRTTALSSLRGVRIVKSVAIGGEVGVVVAVSPNFVGAAQALARGEAARNPLPTATDEIIAELDKADGTSFLGEYGTRMAKLSNGETAIFAFGQAGASLTANDVGAFRSTKRRAAQSAATRMAEAQLAQFAKVTTYFVGEDQRFSRITQTLVAEDGVATEQQTQEVGRKLMESIKSAADLRLDGAMVVKRWSVSDPGSGDLVEGVVLAWSPSLAGAIHAANRPVAAPSNAAAQGGDTRGRVVESSERQEDW